MRPLHLLAISAVVIVATASGPACADDKTATVKIQLLNPLASSKVTDLNAFSERPLFSAQRRPKTREEPPDDVEPMKDTSAAADFNLLGVTSGPQGAMARIARSGKQSRSVREGEEIDGWNVQTIDGSSVVLTQGGETMTLTIFNKGASDDAGSDTLGNSDGGIVFGPADADDTSGQKSP